MKRIRFEILGYKEQYDRETEETKQVESLATVEMPYSEGNLLIAQERAYNGEYTVEDDGQAEVVTQADRIEAQVTYTAMMTDTLLEV